MVETIDQAGSQAMTAKTTATDVKAGRPSKREHFWDALRAALMLLGIPYHTALAYRPGREWIVSSGEGLSVFTYLAEFIHLFRMPAFFLIAGYFAALLLARRAPTEWLRGRFQRLGVPLVVSLATLVPILNLACELSNFALAEALASWRHNSATSGGYWVRHLWFLIVLLYCCVAATLIVQQWPRLRQALVPQRIDDWMAQRFHIVFLASTTLLALWQAIAIELFYKAGLATNLPQQILRIDELIGFAPYFILGCILARAPRTLERMGCFSPVIAVIAVVSSCTSLWFLDDFWPPLGRFVATFAAMAISQMIIAGAKRVGDKPSPIVQRTVAASFVIYLFHLPIIAILVDLGQHLALPTMAKALGVMLLSLLLSYGAFRIAERSPLLAFLYNGDVAKARTG